MEQNNYDNPLKSPIVQEIIMSNRIGAIAVILSEKLDIDNSYMCDKIVLGEKYEN